MTTPGFSPVMMIEVELTQPLPALLPDGECQRAWVLARLHTEPVGVCMLPIADEGLTSEEVAAALWGEMREAVQDRYRAFGLCCPETLPGAGLGGVADEWPFLRRRAEVQAALWEVIDHGRAEGAAVRTDPPAVMAEGVVGAVLTVIQTRLLAQDSDPPDERPVIELFGSLMSLIVLPYLGSGAARRELTRPAPISRGAAGGSAAPGSRFEDHGVRLTYRTGRVLTAIAHYPGASNREIAERAGIVDQGQISKLLARLEGAGVIVNLSEGTSRGAPNAWRLTELGERVEHGVEDHFGPALADTTADARKLSSPR